MSYTATSAKAAGIDINKLTGYIATVSEVSQASAETVGTTFKAIFARMSAIKSGKLVDPEDESDISNVETSLNSVGIKLRDSQNDFRNFGTVLDDVAANWKFYTNVQKSAVASSIAGIHHIDQFRILMENYGTATKYAADATNSTGTALQKYNSSVLTSVQAAQDRLTASFEAMSNTMLHSDFVAGAFNTGAGFLDFLNKIISTVGTIPALAGVAAGALSAIGNKGKPNYTVRLHNMPNHFLRFNDRTWVMF